MVGAEESRDKESENAGNTCSGGKVEDLNHGLRCVGNAEPLQILCELAILVGIGALWVGISWVARSPPCGIVWIGTIFV